MSVHSLGGAYYFVVFKDDYTTYCIVYCLTYKSNVQASISKVTHQIKRETGCPVQTLRRDRGKEFTSRETIQFVVRTLCFWA
jgi:transposase InsO family protein